ASDLAARLDLAIGAQEITPFRQPGGLPLQHPHEHDTVAAKQRQRDLLRPLRIITSRGPVRALGFGERPPAGTPEARALNVSAVMARRCHQGAQAAKTVRDDLPYGDKLGEGLLDLRAEEMGAFYHLVEKRGAVLANERRH